jgi:Tfp pilus assembly protein PilV
MTVALVILGMIIASIFTILNRCVDMVADCQTKVEAFNIARGNMEKLLAQKSLSDTFEYGTSETNPDINWETNVESFYEPVSNKMWMRAVCTCEFKTSAGEDDKVELTQWLTSLSQKQIMQITEQQQREEAYAGSNNENSSETENTEKPETPETPENNLGGR